MLECFVLLLVWVVVFELLAGCAVGCSRLDLVVWLWLGYVCRVWLLVLLCLLRDFGFVTNCLVLVFNFYLVVADC